jgi:hypothetical protein
VIRSVLAYAARGWPVLPLSGKVPAIANGVHGSTCDADTIRQWWADSPQANVGIACHRLCVVDVDRKHGGPAWLKEHASQLRGVTLTAKTGGGGWHLYFRLPEGELRGEIVKGVDLRRGPGQYVCAPPSVHPVTGAYYEWVRQWPSEPAPMPPWLLELCRRPPVRAWSTTPRDERLARGNAFQRAARYLDRCDVAISGAGGHRQTFTVCLKVVSQFSELSRDEVWILLSDWNRRCLPPWSERELEHKIDDALRIARGEVAA